MAVKGSRSSVVAVSVLLRKYTARLNMWRLVLMCGCVVTRPVVHKRTMVRGEEVLVVPPRACRCEYQPGCRYRSAFTSGGDVSIEQPTEVQ